jgi:hypothetical protein
LVFPLSGQSEGELPAVGPLAADSVSTWPWDSGASRPFAKLAESTLKQLADSERRSGSSTETMACDSPENAFDHQVTAINGKFHLWAKQIRLHHRSEHTLTCRMVLIQGQRNEILNTWIFPTAPESCPVFAAELIAMAGMPRLTFIDIQNPAMASGSCAVRELTDQLRARHVGLVCDEEPPQWAIDATLGGYIFSRALAATKFSSIDACYEDYLRCYMRGFLSPSGSTEHSNADGSSLTCRSNAERELHHYQVHHMEHSPGSVFLGKLFGNEWTNDFLRNFLFASA